MIITTYCDQKFSRTLYPNPKIVGGCPVVSVTINPHTTPAHICFARAPRLRYGVPVCSRVEPNSSSENEVYILER